MNPYITGNRPKLYQLMCLKIDGERLKIIQKVGVAWQKVAYSLHFDLSVVRTIEHDYRRTEEACEEMFSRWLSGEACEDITWKRLIEALEDAEHAELARRVRSWLSP